MTVATGSGTTCRNDHCTKYGGFDKLNHRKLNLFDSPLAAILSSSSFLICVRDSSGAEGNPGGFPYGNRRGRSDSGATNSPAAEGRNALLPQ